MMNRIYFRYIVVFDTEDPVQISNLHREGEELKRNFDPDVNVSLPVYIKGLQQDLWVMVKCLYDQIFSIIDD